jgi:hypothetical protein
MKSACPRRLPGSFDPGDVTANSKEVPADWEWTSAAATLKAFGSTGVMMRLPLFWQLEAPLFRACKAADAFIFVCEPQNMPLCAAALRDASIDTVVTDFDDATAFAHYLAARQQELPPHWLIIRKPGQRQLLPARFASLAVAEETHVSPGILAA